MLIAGQINVSTVKPFSRVSFKNIENNVNNSKSSYLLAFDLDGTFLECNKQDIEKFIQLSQLRNCKLAYVSGRVLSELDKIRNDYAKKGINIPMPDYFITSSGQYLYENKNGKMSVSQEWYDILSKGGFNRSEIKSKMETLIEKTKLGNQPQLMQFDYRECNFNLEYLVGAKIKHNFKNTLNKFLKDNNINVRIIYDYVPPEDIKRTLPMFPEFIQNQIKPLLDKDGGLLTFYLAAANKADAVDFLRTKLKLDSNHVVTAGNAGNDISLAQSGFWFIVVNNAQKILKNLIKDLPEKLKEKIIQAKNDGAAGINEALEQIFSKVGLNALFK
ncbi:MAG: HAD family hydrolase [Cyanobacteriota bacterium]